MSGIKLIDNASQFHRFWSVRLGVIGTMLCTVFNMWPDTALYFFNEMPYEVKQLIPFKILQMIGVFIFAMSLIARVIKQEKLQKPIIGEANNAGSSATGITTK